MNNTYKLGRSMAQIVPFYRHIQNKRKEIITNKVLTVMGIVAIAKITVLFFGRYRKFL